MIYPIGFSIPECKLVKEVPDKTLFMAKYRPGQSYSYDSEEAYYKGYQEAVFGWTMKKAGWDCLRHYEILANGCIPWFPNLSSCPPGTMTFFPFTLVQKAMKQIRNVDDPKAIEICKELLDYTREHLTTKAMASYILKQSGHENAKKILYLAPHQMVDYLRCLCLHGFKELLGANCHDFPKTLHMYTDYEGDTQNCYGRGMTVTKNLDASYRNHELDASVLEDIEQRRYDVIVYGSLHRGMPCLDLVMKHYKPNEIIFLCGEDCCKQEEIVFSDMGCHVFIRELSTVPQT